jgi:hypothetical protein
VIKKSYLEIDFDFDFKLWGIATSLRDYQVCLLVNKALKLRLSRLNDIELPVPEHNKLLLFSTFRYEDPMDKGVFHLIANKYNGDFLVPEMRQADFFLRFCGAAPDEYLYELVTKLKRIQQFLMLIPMNPENLKSRMNLMVE